MNNHYQFSKPTCCCVKCKKEISINNIDKHYNSKSCNNPNKTNKTGIECPPDLICIYCNKQCKNKNSWFSHTIKCPKNPNRDPNHFGHMKGKKGSNQHIKGTAKPLTEEQRRKISEKMKERKVTKESREKMSLSMKEAVKKYPDSYAKNNVCGRVKTYEYNGDKLKGTWELKVAQWLVNQNIEYEVEPHSSYYYWNNEWRLYFPDFYIKEHDIYIEVKGYKTERDICKWNYFNGYLIILEKEQIHNIDCLSLENIKAYKWGHDLTG